LDVTLPLTGKTTPLDFGDAHIVYKTDDVGMERETNRVTFLGGAGGAGGGGGNMYAVSVVLAAVRGASGDAALPPPPPPLYVVDASTHKVLGCTNPALVLVDASVHRSITFMFVPPGPGHAAASAATAATDEASLIEYDGVNSSLTIFRV
jgi:hypothetical protein